MKSRFALLTLSCVFAFVLLCAMQTDEKSVHSFWYKKITLRLKEVIDPQSTHELTEEDIEYPESLVKKGLNALVRVEYQIDAEGCVEKIMRTKTYHYLNCVPSRKTEETTLTFAEDPQMKRNIGDYGMFEEEVRRVLMKRGSLIQVKDGPRIKTSDFFFAANRVFARVRVKALIEDVFKAAEDVLSHSEIGLEKADKDKGFVISKVLMFEKEGKKFELSFIVQMEKSASDEKMIDIKSAAILRLLFQPYEKGKKYFRTMHPYHPALERLLKDISRQVAHEDVKCEFIASQKRIPQVFSSRDGKPNIGTSLESCSSKNDLKDPELIRSPDRFSDQSNIARLGASMFAVLQMLINKEGVPENIEILEIFPEGIGYEEQLMKTGSQHRYKPALCKGEPIAANLIFLIMLEKDLTNPIFLLRDNP